MKKNADVVQALEQAVGSKASEADFAGHAGNNTVHITASERQTWNGKADANHSHDYLPLSGGIMNGPIQWFSNEVGHGALIGAFQYSSGNQFCLAPDGWATVESLQSILYLGYVNGELQISPRVNGAPWYLTGFRSKFNSGDADNPTGWANVPVMESGEEHSSLWRKVSLFCKNVRYLWKLIGNTNLSGIGDGTVTGAISALNTGLFGARTYATYNPSNPRLALKNIILPDAFRQHDNNNYFVSVAMESEADAAYAVCFVEKHTGAFDVYFRRNDGADWNINTAVWFSYIVVIHR